MIGSLSSIIVLALIANSVCLYLVFMKAELNYNTLETKITDSQ